MLLMEPQRTFLVYKYTIVLMTALTATRRNVLENTDEKIFF